MAAIDDDAGDPAEDKGTKAGVQSLEIGLAVLQQLARSRTAVTLTDLALACGMPSSKVHRYLSSFVRLGFASQKERTGRYELGRKTAEIGLAAIAAVDFVNAAGDSLDEIAEKTNSGALVAVWGAHGPTVVRWRRPVTVPIISMGLGATLPLLTSATGHVYIAYSNPRLIDEMLDREMSEHQHMSRQALEDEVQNIRQRVTAAGYATAAGPISADYSALSVPVLNWQNEAEAAITITSRDPAILVPDGPAVRFLLEKSRELSLPKPLEPKAKR